MRLKLLISRMNAINLGIVIVVFVDVSVSWLCLCGDLFGDFVWMGEVARGSYEVGKCHKNYVKLRGGS